LPRLKIHAINRQFNFWELNHNSYVELFINPKRSRGICITRTGEALTRFKPLLERPFAGSQSPWHEELMEETEEGGVGQPCDEVPHDLESVVGMGVALTQPVHEVCDDRR
jgi:hypothetical protein